MTSLYALLDVAIVLTGIYTALSCVVSWSNEQIAAVLLLRGETLYVGVLNLVMGEASLASGIFEHPLVTCTRNDKNGKPDLSKPYRPSYLDARSFSVALWQSVNEGKASASANVAATVVGAPQALISSLSNSVDALSNPELKKALSSLLEQAGNDYKQLLAVTDGWFNAQMDRVSGWYKRKSQYFITGIALAVVVVSGLDSLEIATRLYADPDAREKIVAGISAAVPPATSRSSDSINQQSVISPQEQAVTKAIDAQALTNFGSFFHLPWNGGYWHHIPGMFVTLVALTLGGPFWFDLLSSLVNVRSAGRKPQRGDQPPQ